MHRTTTRFLLLCLSLHLQQIFLNELTLLIVELHINYTLINHLRYTQLEVS